MAVMISKMEIFKNILEERGIKPTYQRLKILEYMSESVKSHPTVEMIYEKLAKDIPTISMTTVYNTLNALSEKGLVAAVTITGTETRYDFNTSSHHHFLCKKCGTIIDIAIECPFAVGQEKAVDGHRIEEVHGYFRGICADCLRSEKNKAETSSD